MPNEPPVWSEENEDIYDSISIEELISGADGTAGKVTIFPTTAASGKVEITCVDQAADHVVSIIVDEMAAARDLTIPDPGDDGSFVIDVGMQSPKFTNVDCGASGTAGSLDVFPTTASKGKLSITCTDQTGDTTVSVVAGAMAAARTLTIPDPLAAADFLMGKQAAVARTATNDGLTTAIIAAAGKLQFINVTSGNAANIIVLPTPTPGTIVILSVGANGYELRSSAPATVAINGGAEADAESAIPANSLAILICESATSWKGLQIESDGTLAGVEAAAAA